MKKIKKIYKDKYFIALTSIVLISFIFNFKNIYFQTSFGFDQARDAYEAHSILPEFNLKIQGPSTDIPGVHHGVLWYYALSIPYFLAQQNSQGAAFIFYILSFLTVPFVWMLAQNLFKDKKTSFVTVTLYVFSPFIVAFSTWLSNPILALYITPVLLFFLWSFIQKPGTRSALFIGFLSGLLIQSNISFLLFTPLILAPLFVFKVRPTLLHIGVFIASFTIACSSYILVELKFNGKGIRSILTYLQGDHTGTNNVFIETVIKIKELFKLTSFPFYDVLVYILIFVILIILIKNFTKYKKPIVFCLIWISNIFLFKYFSTGVSHSAFVLIPTVVVAIILTSFSIVKLLRKTIFISIVVMVLTATYGWQNYIWQKDDFNPGTIQKSGTFYNYSRVVDYSYNNSDGSPFTINTVTNPLFVNTTWSYMFEFYGEKKYGYKPYFAGRSQVGYLGNLVEKKFDTDIRYLIIESTIGLPLIYVDKAIYEEDKISDIIEVKRFGYVTVQKRKYHPDKPPIEIPEQLKNSHVLYD